MTQNRNRSPLAFALYLIGSHAIFVVLVWLAFAAAVVVLTTVVAVANNVTESAWDIAASQISRWFALGLGVYLLRSFLPLHIASGRTRRQFMVQAIAFIVGVSAVMALLVTIGYTAEAGIYRSLDWSLVGAPNDPLTVGGLTLITLGYWAMFSVWMLVGMFASAGFYRFHRGGIATIPVGVAMVLVAALGTERVTGGQGGGLPFLADRFELTTLTRLADAGLVGAAGPVAATLLIGIAITWLIVRDTPIRTTSG